MSSNRALVKGFAVFLYFYFQCLLEYMPVDLIKKTTNAQSAIEMLTTYGWAIIVIGLALSMLFYFGVLNPKGAVGTTCVINDAFQCSNLLLSTNGILSFTLLQDKYAQVNITGIGCSENVSNEHILPPNSIPVSRIYMPEGNESNFTVQCYTQTGVFNGAIGTFLNATLYINYINDIGGFPYSSSGPVVIKSSYVSGS